MKRYSSAGKKNTYPPKPQVHVIYSECQEVHCHGCGEELPTDGRQELFCSSRCRVYSLQPSIKPDRLNIKSADAERWLEERYLVDILLRQGGGDREKVADELMSARDRNLKKADDARDGWLQQEHLREEAAKIERVRVLVLEK